MLRTWPTGSVGPSLTGVGIHNSVGINSDRIIITNSNIVGTNSSANTVTTNTCTNSTCSTVTTSTSVTSTATNTSVTSVTGACELCYGSNLLLICVENKSELMV